MSSTSLRPFVVVLATGIVLVVILFQTVNLETWSDFYGNQGSSSSQIPSAVEYDLPSIITITHTQTATVTSTLPLPSPSESIPPHPTTLESLLDDRNLLVAVTMIKNERRNVREWLLYNRLVGINHTIIYDNWSTDGLEDLLQPFIAVGEVTYMKFPPAEGDPPVLLDEDLKGVYEWNLNECMTWGLKSHGGYYVCQYAAFTESIQLARNMKARWIASFDLDEFFWAVDDEYSFDLPGALQKHFADHHQVTVLGYIFGTDGWIDLPGRGPDDLFSELTINSYTGRTPSIMDVDHTDLQGDSKGKKSFVDPLRAMSCRVHHFILNEDYPDNLEIELDVDNQYIRMNHYQYRSRTWAAHKVDINGNNHLNWNPHKDDYFSSVAETTIRDRAGAIIQGQFEKMYKSSPPLHSDDFDQSVYEKHGRGTMIGELNLCVAITTSGHIGLARSSINGIINYMADREPDIRYEIVLIDNGSSVSAGHQLQNDYPWDKRTAFTTSQSPKTLLKTARNLCDAPYVLYINEDWHATSFDWPSFLPAIKMGLNVLEQDKEVFEIRLGDDELETGESDWIVVEKNSVIPFSNELSIDEAVSVWPRTFYYRKEGVEDGDTGELPQKPTLRSSKAVNGSKEMTVGRICFSTDPAYRCGGNPLDSYLSGPIRWKPSLKVETIVT